MQQVRRNTHEFAAVATALQDHRHSSTRRKVIRLYALKPSQALDEKVLINKLPKNAAVLYDMSYDSILQYLEDRSHKLFREGDKPLYYFKTSASSDWIKFPFEFTGALKKKVLPLEVVR